jgi:hypothetical protein
MLSVSDPLVGAVIAQGRAPTARTEGNANLYVPYCQREIPALWGAMAVGASQGGALNLASSHTLRVG